jgi:hypothetical protein
MKLEDKRQHEYKYYCMPKCSETQDKDEIIKELRRKNRNQTNELKRKEK